MGVSVRLAEVAVGVGVSVSIEVEVGLWVGEKVVVAELSEVGVSEGVGEGVLDAVPDGESVGLFEASGVGVEVSEGSPAENQPWTKTIKSR